MRDIKFRIWCNDKKRMFTKVLVGNATDSDRNDYTAYCIFRDGNWHHGDAHDNVIIEQYTGLKDKDGVEIYEGDILSQCAEWNETCHYSGTHSDCETFQTQTVGLVRIYPSKGVIISRAKKMDLIACDNEWERAWSINARSYRCLVIGNIHDNPELLEK